MSKLIVNRESDKTRDELQEHIRNLTFNLAVYHFWYGELPDGLVEDAAARYFALMEAAPGGSRPHQVMEEAIQQAVAENLKNRTFLE